MRAAFALLILVLAPPALAQPAGTDVTIELAPGASPRIEGADVVARVGNATEGGRYELDLALDKEYTTFEVRANGFDLERVRQLVPSLVVPETEFPLFRPYVNERIWEAEATAQLFFAGGTPDAVVLRLGIAGPRNVTLVLERDVTPPVFALGDVANVTHISFYQETTTEELAIGDLQVRRVGSTEWIVNPTPELHVRQRFPVQGLQPSSEYEARVVFTDWAGNEATSETYRVTTSAAPVLPTPVVTPVSPLPDSTVNFTFLALRARVESPESPLVASSLTLFFDKRPVTTGVRFDAQRGEIQYTPNEPLAPGKHFFAVEVRNEAGGKGEARWSFLVEPLGAKEAPGPALLAALGALLVAARLRRN